MDIDQNIIANLINTFSQTLEMFDLSSADARLFTILYLNHQPMTLDEMSQTTGKSKTTVNTGIRNLSDLNLVKQVWKKGVRKDLYTTDHALYQCFMSTYINKWLGHTVNQEESLAKIKAQLASQYKDELIVNKLNEMIAFHTSLKNSFAQMKPTT
ncbi:DNA-binding transcriptional regulator GbsR, MarR family [Amphibacillus marinus]|uniref:HTH-type transcriptional regulator n=1 Tax=Amphibacillus marinus TaxID=872970 RepID=A0A1H8RU78_9BACI|nr:helix-turn-helix domain-containing protein [Amphibacillus marinus]SEO69708.1 DNA-binding transcriptional regulator GbsR, MarR family [Amphibacillus marinus]